MHMWNACHVQISNTRACTPHLPYFRDHRKKCSTRYPTTNLWIWAPSFTKSSLHLFSNRRVTPICPIHSPKLNIRQWVVELGKLFFTRMLENTRLTRPWLCRGAFYRRKKSLIREKMIQQDKIHTETDATRGIFFRTTQQFWFEQR